MKKKKKTGFQAFAFSILQLVPLQLGLEALHRARHRAADDRGVHAAAPQPEEAGSNPPAATRRSTPTFLLSVLFAEHVYASKLVLSFFFIGIVCCDNLLHHQPPPPLACLPVQELAMIRVRMLKKQQAELLSKQAVVFEQSLRCVAPPRHSHFICLATDAPHV
jgi:hypothetical protein